MSHASSSSPHGRIDERVALGSGVDASVVLPDADWGLRDEVRRLIDLGFPVVLTQLGLMGLGVVDMLMLGQLGVHELDASALGNTWLMGTVIFGMGVMFGLDSIITQAIGANDGERAGLALQRGVVAGVICSVPIGALLAVTGPVLLAFGQAPDLAADAHRYVVLQIPTIPFFLAFNALRQYLQGRGVVRPGLWVVLAGNALNVVFNWALIFGHLGSPALGLEGAALATSATRIVLPLLLLGVTWWFRLHDGAWVPWSRAAFDRQGLREVFGFGLPVGLQYGLEMWAFQVCTLMAGWLGKHELAAHSIVLNLASVSFMMPLGVSIGAAVRVGNLIGAKKPWAAQRAAMVAFVLGAGVMTSAAAIFVALRWVLPGLFTEDTEVIALAAALLPVAAAFQLFDGTQVVGGGVLRGMGTPMPAVVVNLIGYYALALPLAYALAFWLGWGLVGIWWALAAGLAVVAVTLVVWVRLRGPAQQASAQP